MFKLWFSFALELGDYWLLPKHLPNSTPHWSKESTFHMVPWVKTLCS